MVKTSTIERVVGLVRVACPATVASKSSPFAAVNVAAPVDDRVGRLITNVTCSTYLGRYTEHVTLVINLPTLSSTGAATFTAANGDDLLATVAGQATRTSPTTLSIVEVFTITGGTGRFADATGTFALKSTLDQTTGVSTGTFSGTIDH